MISPDTPDRRRALSDYHDGVERLAGALQEVWRACDRVDGANLPEALSYALGIAAKRLAGATLAPDIDGGLDPAEAGFLYEAAGELLVRHRPGSLGGRARPPAAVPPRPDPGSKMSDVDKATAGGEGSEPHVVPTISTHFDHTLITSGAQDARNGPGRPLGQELRLWERRSVHSAAPSMDVTLDSTLGDEVRAPHGDRRGMAWFGRPGGGYIPSWTRKMHRGQPPVSGRRQRRHRTTGSALGAGLLVLAGLLTGCGSSKPNTASATSPPGSSSTSTLPSTTDTTSDTPATTTPTGIGGQAFATYQHAFAVLVQIEGDPAGRSTDPRLAQVIVNPWYSELVQEINQLRLKNEVVKGSYSFSNFRLDQVTADGRVIFTDCQTNSQEVYSAKTGAPVSDSGTSRIPEQVVVYHPAGGAWRVADDNTNTAGSASACAG
jgi:hypothetical protein